MKIVFVTSCLQGGGAERVVSILVNYFSSHGDYEVKVVMYNDYEIFYKVNYNVEFVALKGSNLEKLHMLRENIKKCNYIISFDYSICIRTYIATLFLKKIHIMSERNDPHHNIKRRIVRIARNYVYSKAEAVVFQTEEAMSFFSKRIKRKGHIIENPVDYAKMPLQTNHGKESKRFIAVGRLEPQKNFSMLIEVFSEFHKIYESYSLVLFGEGNEKEMLQNLISENNLTDVVEIRNFTRNIYEEMSNSTFYISTSSYEGISNAMLEAVCIGLPVIVTDCNNGGVRNYVIDGKNGYIVPVDDRDALFQRMCDIVDNKELVAGCLAYNLELRKKVSIDTIGEKWKELIARFT